MSGPGIFNHEVSIHRYSSVLYDGTVAETTISADPSEEALIRVTLDSPQTGTISLVGSTVETLAFDDSEYAESTALFTSLSGVTPSCLSGEMRIAAFDEAGEPVQNLNYIGKTHGHFAPKDNRQYLQLAGTAKDFAGMLFLPADADIEVGDIVRLYGKDEDYIVEGCVDARGLDSATHTEIILASG